MNALLRHLAFRIGAEGPLSIADYMAEALGHPAYGYYTTRDPLGARGDFITAPEVSQVFGELIGLWCAESWARLARPEPVILAELGPGRGTLMADALRAFRVVPDFRRALRLHLVETSTVLRRAQAQALGAANPTWHETLATVPPGPLILIANEFLDALPVHQFLRSERGWHERRVALAADGASLVFTIDGAPSPAADQALPGEARAGSLCETRPAALALARGLGERLTAQGGLALFIDYGYFPSACGDTLQALRRHRRHDVLAEPGTADLTAHVDFAAVAAAGRAGGARVWGPVAQGAFLSALGLEARRAKLLERATPAQAEAIAGGCRRLIDPAGMGTLFKALALADPALPAPAGFVAEALP